MRPCDDFSYLMAKLKRGSRQERINALAALADRAPATPEILSSVRAAVDDEDPDVRREALIAYSRLDSGDPFPRERIQQEMSYTDDVCRLSELLTLLESVTSGHLDVIYSACRQLLRHPDLRLQTQAISTIRNCCIECGRDKLTDLIPDLVARTHSESEKLRAESVLLLLVIGPPETETILPDLIRLCSDPDMDCRVYTYEALSDLGPAARAAIPTLVKRLREEESGRRFSVARAIEAIGLADDQYHRELYDALANSDSHMIGPLIRAAERVRPFLDDALRVAEEEIGG